MKKYNKIEQRDQQIVYTFKQGVRAIYNIVESEDHFNLLMNRLKEEYERYLQTNKKLTREQALLVILSFRMIQKVQYQDILNYKQYLMTPDQALQQQQVGINEMKQINKTLSKKYPKNKQPIV